MIMVNIGSRYVIGDLGKFHDYILNQEIVKKIIIFCLFFVATRDVTVSFVLTILYVIVIDGMLHEKRNFCILPQKMKEKFTSKVSDDEYKKALNVISLYEKQDINEKTENQDVYEIYKKSIENL